MSNSPLDSLLQESGNKALTEAASPTKADILNAASEAKRSRLATLSGIGDKVVTGVRTGAGGYSMDQAEYDARTLLPSQYADKYGINALNQLQSDIGAATVGAENTNFIDSAVTGTQQVKDVGVGIGSGVINIGLGLAELGALATPYASDVAGFSKDVNNFMDQGLSDATLAERQAAQNEYQLSDRDNQQVYLDSKDTSLTNKAKRELSNLGDRLGNLGKYGLGDANVVGQAIGSIGGIGLATKAVAKGGGLLVDKILSEAGAKAAGKIGDVIRYPAMVGATEGGSAATDAINQVLALPQSVIEANPEYQSIKNSNPTLTHQQIVEQLANKAGLTAAAITAPVAAALGTLTKGFNDKSVLPTASSLRGLVGNAAKETVEEVPQSITGTTATNIGVQQYGDTNRDVLKDTGQSAYDALIGSVGSVAATGSVPSVVGSTASVAESAVTAVNNKIGESIKAAEAASTSTIVNKANEIKNTVVPKVVEAVKKFEEVSTNSDTPPETQAHIELTKRLTDVFVFSATKEDVDGITESPKLREALYGTDSVASAITRLSDFSLREDITEAERFDATVNILNFVSAAQEALSQEADVLSTHGNFAPLKEYRQAMSTNIKALLDSNVIKGKVEETTKELYNNALKSGYILPINPTNLTNPTTQQAESGNLDKTINVILQSKVLPEEFKGSVDTLLQMVNSGFTSLSPKQVKSLQSIEALYKEGGNIEQDAADIGADGTAFVNNQVINSINSDKDINGRQLGNRLSVRGHVNSIVNALNANDTVSYENRVKRFRAFVLEHNAKADAVDLHIKRLLNKELKNNERTPYSKTVTGKQGLYVNLNSASSIANAKAIQQEAVILSRSFARLLKAFGSETDLTKFAIPKKMLERKVNNNLLSGLTESEPINNNTADTNLDQSTDTNVNYDAYSEYMNAQDSTSNVSPNTNGRLSKDEWKRQQAILQSIRNAKGVESATQILNDNANNLSSANIERANKLILGKKKYEEQQSNKKVPKVDTPKPAIKDESPSVPLDTKEVEDNTNYAEMYDKDIESGLDVLDALDTLVTNNEALTKLDVTPYSKASLLVLSEALKQDEYSSITGLDTLKNTVENAINNNSKTREQTPDGANKAINTAQTTPVEQVSTNGVKLTNAEYTALVGRYNHQLANSKDPMFTVASNSDKTEKSRSKYNFTEEQLKNGSALELLQAIPSSHPMYDYAQLMIPLVKRNPIKVITGITLADGTNLVVQRSSAYTEGKLVMLAVNSPRSDKGFGDMSTFMHEVSHILFKEFFNGKDPRSVLPQGKALVDEYKRIYKEYLDTDVKPVKEYSVEYAKNPNEFYAVFFNSVGFRKHLSTILDKGSTGSLLDAISNLLVKVVGLGKVKPNLLESLSSVLATSLVYLDKGEVVATAEQTLEPSVNNEVNVSTAADKPSTNTLHTVVGSDLAFDNQNPLYNGYVLEVPSNQLALLGENPLSNLTKILKLPVNEVKAKFKGLNGLTQESLDIYKNIFEGFVPVLVESFSGEVSKAISKGSLNDEVGKSKGTGLSSIATIVASELSESVIEKQSTAIRRAIAKALPNVDFTNKTEVESLVKSFRRFTNVSVEKTLYERTKKELEDAVVNAENELNTLKAELKSKESDEESERSARSVKDIEADIGYFKADAKGATEALKEFNSKHSATMSNINAEYLQLTSKTSAIMGNLTAIRTELAKEFKAGTIAKDTLVLRKELNNTADGKAFAFTNVEWNRDAQGNTNAHINLNQPLIETAAIGALQWLIYKSSLNGNAYMEKSDASEMLGMPEEEISNEYLALLRSSLNVSEAVESMSQFIQTALQIRPKGGDTLIGDTQGVVNALASTFLDIMTKDGDFKLTSNDISSEGRHTKFTVLTPSFAVAPEKGKFGNKVFYKSILNNSPDILSPIVSKPNSDNVFIGSPDDVPVMKTLLRSDIPITKEQKLVIEKANKVEFKIHSPMLKLYDALGSVGLISIAGSMEVVPSTTNVNTLATREGQNLQIISSLQRIEGTIAKVKDYAKVNNKLDTDVGIYFPNAFVSTNRLQQNSSFSPQASKVTRTVISTTIRDVDLTNPDAKKLFIIATAQGMGVKVHNLSYESIEKELNNILKKPEVKEAIRALRDIESKGVASETAINKLKAAYPAIGNTLWGLSALVEYKRFKDVETSNPTELSKFRTNAAIEADGMTNGTANALHIMLGYPLTEGDVVNWMRTGFYVGNENTNANIERAKDVTDIYASTSTVMQSKLLEKKKSIIDNFKEKLANKEYKKYTTKTVNNLVNKGGLDLMYSFVESFSPNVSIDKEKGTLILKRNFSKQPVTVVVYGASTNTMVQYILQDILDNIYESMSDHLSGKNVWSQAKVDSFNKMVHQLGSLSLTSSSFGGVGIKYRMTPDLQFDKNPSIPQVSLSNPDSFRKFTIDGETLRFIQSNLNIIIGIPLESSITTVLGDGLLDSMTNVTKSTSLHSLLIEKAFNRDVKDAQLKEVRASSKASIAKFIRGSVLKDVTKNVSDTFKATYEGNDQNFYITNKEGRSNLASNPIGSSLGGKFASFPKIRSLVGSSVGVKGAPILTIGNGDASMIQRYIASLSKDINALYVYDGIEFSIEDIMDQSVEINKSVFDTWTSNNVPKQVVTSFKEAIKLLTPDMVDSELAFAASKAKGETLSSYEGIKSYLELLASNLEEMASVIDDRQNTLKEYGSSIHQMASVESPYLHKGKKFKVNTPEGIASELNSRLRTKEGKVLTDASVNSDAVEVEPSLVSKPNELIGSESKASVSKEEPVQNQKSTGKSVRSVQDFVQNIETVVDIKDRADKQTVTLIKRIVESGRSNLVDTQIMVANDVKEAIRLANDSGLLNEAELAKFTKVISKNESNALYMFPANFIIVLKNKDILTSIAHELIHAATFNSVAKAYSKDNKLDLRTRDGKILSIIEKLMNEFIDDSFKEYATKSGSITSYSNVAKILKRFIDRGDKASAVSEFMAYTLSNRVLADLAKSRKGDYSIARAAKAVIAYIKNILGISDGVTVFNNMLDSLEFHTLMLANPEANTNNTDTGNVILEQRNTDRNSVQNLLDRAFSKLSIIRDDAKKKSTDVLDKVDLTLESSINNVDNLVKLGFHMDEDSKKLYSVVSGIVAADLLNDSSTLNKLSSLYQRAITNLSVDDFMLEGVSDSTARDMYNSLLASNSANKTGDPFARFVGLLAASDHMKEVISKLSFTKESTPVNGYDSLISRTGELILNALDPTKLQGNGGTIADKLIDDLTSMQGSSRALNAVEKAFDTVNKLNQEFSNYISTTIPTITKRLVKVGSSLHPTNPISIAANISVIGLSFLNKQLTNELAQGINNKLDRVVGWEPARDLLSDLIGRTNDNAHIYDLIKPIKTFVAKTRQTYRTEVPNKLLKSFVNPISKDELSLLTRVIADTGLHHLGSNRAVNLLEGTVSAESIIDSSLDLLSNYYSNEQIHYIFTKVTQLAKYTITHEAGDHLLRNAYAIASLLGSEFPNPEIDFNKSQSKAVVNVINNLIAVSTLDYVSDEDKVNVLSVINNNKEGMLTTLDYMRTIYSKDTDKILASETALYNHYYGYLNKSKIDSSELLVLPSSNVKAMALQGFTYIGDYYGDYRDNLDTPLGYYYRDISPNNIFTQGLVQNIDSTIAGVNASTGLSESGLVGIVVSDGIIEDINNNPYENTSESLIPMYSNSGTLVSYERTVSNKIKAITEYESDITKILGATRGRQVEEIAASYWNHKLIDTLNLDYNQSVDKSGYVDILDPKAFINDPINKDAVSIFSNSFIDMVKGMGANSLYVKRELIREVIGYRKASVTDMFTGKTRLDPRTVELVKTGIVAVFGKNAFKYLTYAENTLVEGVQAVRTIIAVKSIIVPIANILGNLLHLASTSVNMVKGVKRIPMFVQEVEEYMSNQKRIVDIEVDMATTQNMYELRKLRSELAALKNSNKRMKISPLIEAGELSGLNDAGYLDRDWDFLKGINKDIKQYIENVISITPDSVINVGKQILVTKDTALYNGLQKTVMYGDFIAKAVLYYDLLDKGVSDKEAKARIQEEFVNYDKLSGRARDALESYGLLWFYNFKLRSIKIALNMLRNNPLHTLLIGLGISEPLNLGTAFTDNAIGLAIEGNLGYSIGADMAVNGFSLNPYHSLIN